MVGMRTAIASAVCVSALVVCGREPVRVAAQAGDAASLALRVEPEALVNVTAFVVAPWQTLPKGELSIVVKVQCGELKSSARYKVLGPKPESGS